MQQSAKSRVILGFVVMSLLLAGVFIVRYFVVDPTNRGLTDEQREASGAVNTGSLDDIGYPPQGDMSDDEYGRLLHRLRAERDAVSAEPGSALRPIEEP